jgi:hypothetical protein
MRFALYLLGETRFSNGSGGWIRTSDQLINSQLRYHCATPEQSILNYVQVACSISYFPRIAQGLFPKTSRNFKIHAI